MTEEEEITVTNLVDEIDQEKGKENGGDHDPHEVGGGTEITETDVMILVIDIVKVIRLTLDEGTMAAQIDLLNKMRFVRSDFLRT